MIERERERVPDVSFCLNGGGMRRIDAESETLIAHTLRGDGFDASEDGTGRGTPLVVTTGPLCANGKAAGSATQQDAESDMLVAELLPILEAGARTGKSTDDPRAGMGIGEPGDPMFTPQGGKQHAICFDPQQITSKANRSNPQPGDPCHTLAKDAQAPVIAFSCKDSGLDAGDISPTLRAMPHDGSHANAGGQVAVAFKESQSGTREADVHATLDSNKGSRRMEGVRCGMAVRRLTPVECEKLQGFDPGYTNVPYNGKPMADGPRYKMLGNSWAVPCVAWIFERIQFVDDLLECSPFDSE